MDDLNKTLHQLSLEQHLLAMVFLLGYGCALGSMFSTAGRLRAAALALLAAAAFAALTRPWEHGVLLVGCAIGGLALFIAAAWLLSRADVGGRLVRSISTAGPADSDRSARPGRTAQLVRQLATRIARRRRRRERTV